jgi:hypothetical protein
MRHPRRDRTTSFLRKTRCEETNDIKLQTVKLSVV